MKYIIYCRKSSESEERQILSIESQEKELLDFASKNNFSVFKIFKESMSAKSPGRPVFNEMMSLIEKLNGDCCVLVWSVDRLSRNALDGGMISWYMDRKLITEIKTPSKTIRNTPDDKFMLSLDFGMSKKYVDDLSVNVKRGNRAKMEKGDWPGYAPLGYLNDRANKVILIDPERAHYIKRCFELFSTSLYTLMELKKILQEEGFRSRGGCIVSKSSVHRILNNTFYYGLMTHGGNSKMGKHIPLITKELFDKAQMVLNRKSRLKPDKKFFHLRGLFYCNVCGCTITASRKKNHDYYYCTNGKKICNQHNKYIKAEDLDNYVADIMDKLSFSDRLINIAYQSAINRNGNKIATSLETKESLLKQLSEVKKKQDRLLEVFLDEITSKEQYEAKMKKLKDEEASIVSKMANIDKDVHIQEGKNEKIRDFLFENQGLKNEYFGSQPEQKRLIVNKLLWNLSLQDGKVLNYQAKEPFRVLLECSKMGKSEILLRR